MVKHRKASKYYDHDCSLVFSYSMGSASFYFYGYCVTFKILLYLCIFYDEKPTNIFHGCVLLLPQVSVSKTSIYFEVDLIYPRHSLIATGNLFSKNHPHTMHFRDVIRTLMENTAQNRSPRSKMKRQKKLNDSVTNHSAMSWAESTK